jgi:hypothetical protein
VRRFSNLFLLRQISLTEEEEKQLGIAIPANAKLEAGCGFW